MCNWITPVVTLIYLWPRLVAPHTTVVPVTNVTYYSGTDLWCLECSESYLKYYSPYDSPCRNNLSLVTRRQCDYKARYCKVEREELLGQITKMTRTCSSTCYWGCRFNGYGLVTKKCTSCCRQLNCNDDNSALSWTLRQPWIVFWAVLAFVLLDLT